MNINLIAMRWSFIFFLASFSFQSFSQNKVAEKITDLRIAGNLDSIYLKPTYYNNEVYNDLIHRLRRPMAKWVYIYKDTIYKKNGDYEVGTITLDTVSQFSNIPIGFWTFYYSIGDKKSQGHFLTGVSIFCGTVGPNLDLYSYNTGDWIFWYANGQVMAKGHFVNKKEKFENNCGGDYHTISITTRKWNFFDQNGNQLKTPTSEMKKIINETRPCYECIWEKNKTP